MSTHRFMITVEVPDDHHAADDAEWWADAATGALGEYGAVASFDLSPSAAPDVGAVSRELNTLN